MNIVLIIVAVIVAIVVVILIAASFSSKDYQIAREITISRPKQEIFDYIRLLKNQDHYSKWVMTDPNMRKDFRGVDGTVGFVYAWDSDNKQVGKGEQEIKKIIDGERMDCEVRFIKPFEGTSYTSFTTESIGQNETRVTWIFTGVRNYAAKIFHIVFNLKKVLGKDMEISLTRLKNNLEK